MSTMRIKATDPEQGAFVVIEEVDFDPAKHEKYVEGGAPNVTDTSRMNKTELLAHLDSLGIEHAEGMTKAELLTLLPQ